MLMVGPSAKIYFTPAGKIYLAYCQTRQLPNYRIEGSYNRNKKNKVLHIEDHCFKITSNSNLACLFQQAEKRISEFCCIHRKQQSKMVRLLSCIILFNFI